MSKKSKVKKGAPWQPEELGDQETGKIARRLGERGMAVRPPCRENRAGSAGSHQGHVARITSVIARKSLQRLPTNERRYSRGSLSSPRIRSKHTPKICRPLVALPLRLPDDRRLNARSYLKRMCTFYPRSWTYPSSRLDREAGSIYVVDHRMEVEDAMQTGISPTISHLPLVTARGPSQKNSGGGGVHVVSLEQ